MFQPLGLVAARVMERIAARSGRDMERGRQEAARVRAAGGSALDAAIAQIGTSFDGAAAINSLKLRVLNWIRLGADHEAVRARFGARARMLAGLSLAEATATVERCYREEKRALEVARAFGRGNALSLDVLIELRLMLRLARRTLTNRQFRVIVARITDAAEGRRC